MRPRPHILRVRSGMTKKDLNYERMETMPNEAKEKPPIKAVSENYSEDRDDLYNAATCTSFI